MRVVFPILQSPKADISQLSSRRFLMRYSASVKPSTTNILMILLVQTPSQHKLISCRLTL